MYVEHLVFYMSNMIIFLLWLPKCKDLIFMWRYSLHFNFCGLGKGEAPTQGRKIIFNLFADLFIPQLALNSYNISISFSCEGTAKNAQTFCTPELFSFISERVGLQDKSRQKGKTYNKTEAFYSQSLSFLVLAGSGFCFSRFSVSSLTIFLS